MEKNTLNCVEGRVSRRVFIKSVVASSVPLFAGISGCTGVFNPPPTGTPAPSPTLSAPGVIPAQSINVPLRPINLCYSPFREGQNPDLGPGICVYPTEAQIEEDIIFLKNITSCIRTYASSLIYEKVPGIARRHGLMVHQGIYLGNDPVVNNDEIIAAKRLVDQKLVDSLIVGNETLMLNKLSKSDLIGYIRQVKAATPANIPVTTADGWVQWKDNPDLVKEVDYILVHIYPFWDDKPIDNAASYVLEKYQLLKSLYKDKQVIIGETGWPSAGDPKWTGVSGNVVPGEQNQRRFIEEFDRLARENEIRYFLFDAFDEEWKWKERRTSGNDGPLKEPDDRNYSGRYAGSSWGIFRADSVLKPELSNIFKVNTTISSRYNRDVSSGDQLCAGYDMGVNTDLERHEWLSKADGCFKMAYPANQKWGSVYITIGKPGTPPHPWKDFSGFGKISIDLKGEHGGESLEIGLKDASDGEDGTEDRVTVSGLKTDWGTYTFDLSNFHSADLTRLYVVLEFVFSDIIPKTVSFRNITYMPGARRD